MNEERSFDVGDIVKHFKGKFYEVVSFAYDATNECKVVIYRALYGYNDPSKRELFVRELNEFYSKVDKNKYPESKQEFRFERIGTLEFLLPKNYPNL